MLLPLALPPGVMANGTALQAQGRWRDASLVRWHDGAMGPVGGWQAWYSTTLAKAPRAMLAWQDLSNNRRVVFAAHDTVVSVSEGGVAVDITPAGLTAGNLSGALSSGYGAGFYGSGAYGTPRVNTGTYSEATTWALDTWGEYLIACSNADGRLWVWDLNPANNLAVVHASAPVNCLSALVTAERFLFALGADGNPRRVKWCDREDYTVWTAAATNEAGDLDLQSAGQIMCGLRVNGGALILTDLDAHLAVYQGPPFVYGFNQVGASCGAASRKAAVAVDGRAFWMGQSGFYAYAGGEVQQIPCEVSDVVFDSLNRAQQSKVVAVANSQFGEVWWFYTSDESSENDRYVAYNYRENHWSIGELSRTAGVDRGVFSRPIWADATGAAYNHEIGPVSGTVYAESGPIQLGNGDAVAKVVGMIPDERTQGDVQVRFKARFHPNDTEREYGPYTMANPTSLRFTGRQVAMRVEQARASDWRAGLMRLDVVAGGRR